MKLQELVHKLMGVREGEENHPVLDEITGEGFIDSGQATSTSRYTILERGDDRILYDREQDCIVNSYTTRR